MEDLADKTNYRPVSVLLLMSTIFEQVKCKQPYEHLNYYLNDLLCGVRMAHTTHHAMFRLI